MKKLLLGAVIATLSLSFLSASADIGTGTGTVTDISQTSGITGTGRTHSGAEQDLKGIHLAIGQLSPADRSTLIKIITDYLASKGIDVAKYADKKEEGREIRKDAKEEIKTMKKNMKEEIQSTRKTQLERMKKMREEMRAKIQALR